jgi:hypothetical protein
VGEESKVPSVITFRAQMAKKVLKTPNNKTVKYKDPQESNTLHKDSHMMAL